MATVSFLLRPCSSLLPQPHSTSVSPIVIAVVILPMDSSFARTTVLRPQNWTTKRRFLVYNRMVPVAIYRGCVYHISFQAVYGKLGRFNPAVSEAVVGHSAQRCRQLLALLPQARAEPFSGYRMRVLDGNVLAGTEHRLTPLRQWLNASLPRKVAGGVRAGVRPGHRFGAVRRRLYPGTRLGDADTAAGAGQRFVRRGSQFLTTRLVFGVSRQEVVRLGRRVLLGT